MERSETDNTNERRGLHRRDLGKLAVATGAVWAVPSMVLVPAASAQGSRCPDPLPPFTAASLTAGDNTTIVVPPTNTADLSDATPMQLQQPQAWPQSQAWLESTSPVVLGAPLNINGPAAASTSYVSPGPGGQLPAGVPLFSVYAHTLRTAGAGRGVFFGGVSVAAPWVIIGFTFGTSSFQSSGLAGFEAPGTTYAYNSLTRQGYEPALWPAQYTTFMGPSGQTGTQDSIQISADRRTVQWGTLARPTYADDLRLYIAHEACGF
jgi:hypothetical protein